MSKSEKKEKKEEEESNKEISIQQYANFWGQEEIDGISDVLEGSVLFEGPKVREFEKTFANFVGAKYCVLMPNPTLSLYAALIVARPKLAQYVRIPDFGSIEIFNAVIMARLQPLLCDVNDSCCLDLRDNEAGIAAHFNGRQAKPTVLEVCFDAIDKHTKNLISVYDFNYDRHVSLGGKGGAVCTDSEEEYNLLLRFKDQGLLERGAVDHEYWGIDLQVTEFQAAYGLAQMQFLQKKLDSVRGFYDRFKSELEDNDNFLFLTKSPSMRVDLFTREPEKLAKYMSDHNVFIDKMPKPLHLQKICSRAQRIDKDFIFANTIYNTGVFLPSSPIMEKEQIDRMVNLLKEFNPK